MQVSTPDLGLPLSSAKDTAQARLARAILRDGGLNNLALTLAKIMASPNHRTGLKTALRHAFKLTAQLTTLALDMVDITKFQIISATTAQELVAAVVSHLQPQDSLQDEDCDNHVDHESPADFSCGVNFGGDPDEGKLRGFPRIRAVYRILSPWAWLFRQRVVQRIDLALTAKVE